MSIQIKSNSYNEELSIETSRGTVKIKVVNTTDLRIENEEILKEIGLTLSDAIALFFDKAAKPATREKFGVYLSKRNT